MKLVVIVRTRNEERNIVRFCIGYSFADKILVADGMSDDHMVELASYFPWVSVRPYTEITQMKNGYWRTPHGKHINFLIDWAVEEKADWIIFDDCDCWPNYLLRRDARSIFESCTDNYVYVVRLYLYGQSQHFPRLAQPLKVGQWEPSLWAWRPSTGMRFLEEPNRQNPIFPIPAGERRLVFPEYCLLHNAWPDPEATDAKIAFYRESGQISGMQHPLKFGGNLEKLPEWAHE